MNMAQITTSASEYNDKICQWHVCIQRWHKDI